MNFLKLGGDKMKAPKPVALMSKNMTKEEKESRLEQEEKLKGNTDKVYKLPTGTHKEIGKVYKGLVKELKEAEILNNLDIEVLMSTANAIYQMRLARQHILQYGSVITICDPENPKIVLSVKKNPSVQVEKDYHGIFHTGCLQLGLSPSARARMTIIKVSKEEGEGVEEKIFG